MTLLAVCHTILREAIMRLVIMELILDAQEHGRFEEITTHRKTFVADIVCLHPIIRTYLNKQVVTVETVCEWTDLILEQCLAS